MRAVWMIGLAGALLLVVGGCAESRGTQGGPLNSSSAGGAEGVMVVNAWCGADASHPVSAGKIADRSRFREWRGQRVGFCCEGCAAAWDGMRDEQRSVALGAAIKREQTDGRPAQP